MDAVHNEAADAPPGGSAFSAFDDEFADFASFDASDPETAASPAANPFVSTADSPAPAELLREVSPAAAPTSDGVDDDGRIEFERQRQRRLQQLEQQREQVVQGGTPSSSSSSSSLWGGWLSMAGASGDSFSTLRTLASDAERAKARLTERAATAASALQSPGAGLAELRAKMQSRADDLLKQSPVASLAKSLDGLTKPSAGSGASGSTPKGTAASLMPALLTDPKQWALLAGASGGGASADGSAGLGEGGAAMGGERQARASKGRPPRPACAKDDPSGAATERDQTKTPSAPLSEVEQLEAYFEQKDYGGAARLVAGSSTGALRTLATLRRFQAVPPRAEGDQAPILVYFGALLALPGPLSTEEGLELARPVVAQGQLPLLQRWVGEGKLEQSEALADVIRERDPRVAYAMYEHVGAVRKGVVCQAELGDVEEVRSSRDGRRRSGGDPPDCMLRAALADCACGILPTRYGVAFPRPHPSRRPSACATWRPGAVQVAFLCTKLEPPMRPDWSELIGTICALPGGTPRAIALDTTLRARPPPPPPPDPDDELAVMAFNMNPPPPAAPSRPQASRVFLKHGAVQHATKLALDALGTAEAADLDAPLQTALLDANLRADAGVGEALIEAESFGGFDRPQIAATCEEVGRYAHALRLHTSPGRVARLLCLTSASGGGGGGSGGGGGGESGGPLVVSEDAALARIRTMTPTDGLSVVGELLRDGGSVGLARSLAIAGASHAALGHDGLVEEFKAAGSEVGLLCYLSARLASQPDQPDLTLSYLRACLAAARIDEIERVTRDRAIAYDAKAVLALLTTPATKPAATPGDCGDGGGGGQAPTAGPSAAHDARLDPRPIINVCDRFELAAEMATILHERRQHRHLALYVQRVNPTRAPQILGALLDAGCEPARAAELISSLNSAELARDPSLAARLIAACDDRGQLSMLQGWLGARQAEGTLADDSDAAVAVHEALQRLAPKKKGLWGSLMG